MKKISYVFILALFFIGCARYLPSAKTSTESPFNNYNEAQSFYEKINQGSELAGINKEILTYTDILQLYLSNFNTKKEDLDEGIQKCLAAKNRGFGYKIHIKVTNQRRIGNFWKDLLRFNRTTKTTGWEFKALVLIVDDKIVYKERPGGKPNISEEDIEKRPLGPVQEIGDTATGAVKSLIY